MLLRRGRRPDASESRRPGHQGAPRGASRGAGAPGEPGPMAYNRQGGGAGHAHAEGLGYSRLRLLLPVKIESCWVTQRRACRPPARRPPPSVPLGAMARARFRRGSPWGNICQADECLTRTLTRTLKFKCTGAISPRKPAISAISPRKPAISAISLQKGATRR